MVIICSISSCGKKFGQLHSTKRSRLRFHRFPLNNKHLLRKWIMAIQKFDWQPTENSFLCNEHFRDGDYCQSSQQLTLNSEAIPTIFKTVPLVTMDDLTQECEPSFALNIEMNDSNETPMPDKYGVAEHEEQMKFILKKGSQLPGSLNLSHIFDLLKQKNMQNTIKKSLRKSGEESKITLNLIDDVTMAKKLSNISDKGCACQYSNNYVKSLQCQVNYLKRKTKRLDAKIAEFEEQIKSGQSKQTSNTTVMDLITNYKLLPHKNGFHGNRYNSEIRSFALKVYAHSPSTYRFLRTLIPLPHPSLMKTERKVLDLLDMSETSSNSSNIKVDNQGDVVNPTKTGLTIRREFDNFEEKAEGTALVVEENEVIGSYDEVEFLDDIRNTENELNVFQRSDEPATECCQIYEIFNDEQGKTYLVNRNQIYEPR